MIVAIHQPQFMPWLGYFDKIIQSDAFVFLDTVQFKKNEFQNRNKIKNAQGWMWLTVPVSYKYPQYMKEVKINNGIDWRKKHIASLTINYQRSTYFHTLFPDVEQFYTRHAETIAGFNSESIIMLLKSLGVVKDTVFASTLGDLPDEPSERLAAICAAIGADTYLSGAGGKTYLDQGPFHARGIKVVFQEFQHPVYPQLYGDFIPNLSLLDLIFNCGPHSLLILEGKL
jgi:hypothetical protein